MFRKSVQILKNNFVFIQPLLLFLLLCMTAMSFIAHRNLYLQSKILLLISVLLLFIAFIAGWFHINKYGVLNYDEKDTPEQVATKALQNIKKFFEGVGLNFFRTFFSILVVFALYAAITYGLYCFCINTFGELTIIDDIVKLSKAESQAEVLSIYNSIPKQEMIVLSNWFFVFGSFVFIFNVCTLFYLSTVIFEKSNIFKCLWLTIKFMIKNFVGTLQVFILIFALYLILNILSALFGISSFGFIVLIILFSMYLNYSVLLVFCFYDEKARSSSNSRTEFIG